MRSSLANKKGRMKGEGRENSRPGEDKEQQDNTLLVSQSFRKHGHMKRSGIWETGGMFGLAGTQHLVQNGTDESQRQRAANTVKTPIYIGI